MKNKDLQVVEFRQRPLAYQFALIFPTMNCQIFYAFFVNMFYCFYNSFLLVQLLKTSGRTENKGTDGGKTKDRKRHIVIDMMGNLLSVVHVASIHDAKAGIFAAKKAIQKYPYIQRFCANAGYRNSFEKAIEIQLKRGVDISTRIKNGWEIIPKRWVVEQSFS